MWHMAGARGCWQTWVPQPNFPLHQPPQAQKENICPSPFATPAESHDMLQGPVSGSSRTLTSCLCCRHPESSQALAQLL